MQNCIASLLNCIARRCSHAHAPPPLPCARRRRFASPVTLWPVRMERRGPRRRGRLVAAAAPLRTSTSAPAQSSAATPLPVPASASTAPPRSAQAAPAPARGGRSARRARSRPPLARPRAGRGRRRSGVELRGAGQPRRGRRARAGAPLLHRAHLWLRRAARTRPPRPSRMERRGARRHRPSAPLGHPCSPPWPSAPPAVGPPSSRPRAGRARGWREGGRGQSSARAPRTCRQRSMYPHAAMEREGEDAAPQPRIVREVEVAADRRGGDGRAPRGHAGERGAAASAVHAAPPRHAAAGAAAPVRAGGQRWRRKRRGVGSAGRRWWEGAAPAGDEGEGAARTGGERGRTGEAVRCWRRCFFACSSRSLCAMHINRCLFRFAIAYWSQSKHSSTREREHMYSS